MNSGNSKTSVQKVNKFNTWPICRQELFCSLRAHQNSSDQKEILKDQSAQTTARVITAAYRLWLPIPINRVLNLTKLRSVIYDQSVDSCCVDVWELISTAQILRDQSAQTTARFASVRYRLWLPFSINRLSDLTKLRSVIWNQPVDSSYFSLWDPLSTAQIKWKS